jgi:hypothetical protein
MRLKFQDYSEISILVSFGLKYADNLGDEILSENFAKILSGNFTKILSENFTNILFENLSKILSANLSAKTRDSSNGFLLRLEQEHRRRPVVARHRSVALIAAGGQERLHFHDLGSML